jgi:enamine deaminase RidA (YjgF/YER057c/UK114 family)
VGAVSEHGERTVAIVTRTPVNPWEWSVRFGFDQAELVEAPARWLICSGQTAIDAEGRPQHAGDMAAQVALAMANLSAVLAAADMTLDDVVRITAFTTDVDAFLRVPRDAPASAYTLIGVSRLAYPELLVELEAIAVS